MAALLMHSFKLGLSSRKQLTTVRTAQSAVPTRLFRGSVPRNSRSTTRHIVTMGANRQWLLRKRPDGDIKKTDLELVETPVPAIKDGQVRYPNCGALNINPSASPISRYNAGPFIEGTLIACDANDLYFLPHYPIIVTSIDSPLSITRYRLSLPSVLRPRLRIQLHSLAESSR
eukprot:9477336-Pyramimonas_sp.AAC.2